MFLSVASVNFSAGLWEKSSECMPETSENLVVKIQDLTLVVFAYTH